MNPSMKFLGVVAFILCISLATALEPLPEKLTLAIDSAQLLIVHAKRTLKAADEYQKDLLEYAGNWIELGEFLKSTYLQEHLEAGMDHIRALSMNMDWELDWFHFLFSGRENGNWRVHHGRLTSVSKEVIEDALSKSSKFEGFQDRLNETISILQEGIRVMENAKNWDPNAARTAIAQFRFLNAITSFVTFPEKLCFDKK